MDFYSILKEWKRGGIVLSDTHHSPNTADYIIFQISTTKQTDNIKQKEIFLFLKTIQCFIKEKVSSRNI